MNPKYMLNLNKRDIILERVIQLQQNQKIFFKKAKRKTFKILLIK